MARVFLKLYQRKWEKFSLNRNMDFSVNYSGCSVCDQIFELCSFWWRKCLSVFSFATVLSKLYFHSHSDSTSRNWWFDLLLESNIFLSYTKSVRNVSQYKPQVTLSSTYRWSLRNHLFLSVFNMGIFIITVVTGSLTRIVPKFFKFLLEIQE